MSKSPAVAGFVDAMRREARAPRSAPSRSAALPKSGALRVEDEGLPWGSVELMYKEEQLDLDTMRLEWVRARSAKARRAEEAEVRRRRKDEREEAPTLLDVGPARERAR